jgi:hypothetical protein
MPDRGEIEREILEARQDLEANLDGVAVGGALLAPREPARTHTRR